MMPKPSQNNDNYTNSNFKVNSEKILLETKPNIFLYENNFIFKIIVLFLLVFLFAPIVTLFYSIQSTLLTSFQLNFTNMTAIMELILMLCILIVIIKIILDVLDWKYAKYTLTNQRIIIERGFFHKERIMMPYIKMQDIEVSQTIFERILNVGDIVIHGGHENSDTILDDISNPKEVEEIILSHIGNVYQQNYNPIYPQGYTTYQDEYNNPQNYNRNQRYANDMDYNQNNHRNYENREDVHYYNNENYHKEYEDEYDKSYNNLKYRHKDKLQKNNRNYDQSKMNDDEIIRKHQEMFKKYNK